MAATLCHRASSSELHCIVQHSHSQPHNTHLHAQSVSFSRHDEFETNRTRFGYLVVEFDRRPRSAGRVRRRGFEVYGSSGEASASSGEFRDDEKSFVGDRLVAPKGGSATLDEKNVGGEREEGVSVDSGNGSGNGSAGGGDGGGGGGDGSGGGGEEDAEEKEFGVLLNEEQIKRQLESRGISLPVDMAEAAKTEGIRELILMRYFELQEGPLGAFVRSNAMLRNRLLADPSFLFKILTEITIDSGCATFAEVQKRGKDFWNEFELYLSDLGVGIALDIALVGMLAPYVSFQKISAGSAFFEGQRPGRPFSLQQRLGAFVYKAVQYGVTGFGCGVVGQGIASSIMTIKRKYKTSDEEEVAVPPILQSAALWGVFMAVSSNTRYQVINGLERVVEGSAICRSVPSVALAFTVGIRFANNIYGGMQFVDWARMAGVQ